MKRASASHAAALSHLLSLWRLVAMCTVLLLLTPRAMGQQTVSFTRYPANGWKERGGVWISDRADPATYYATIRVNGLLWEKVSIAAAFGNGLTYSGVEVYRDGILMGSASAPAPKDFTVPLEDHEFEFRIQAPGRPSNSDQIYITSVTTTERALDSETPPATSTRATGTQPPNTLQSNPPNSSSQTFSTSAALSDTNALNQPSTTGSDIPTPLTPSLTNVDPMSGLPSGLLSPPPYTNTLASISNTSLTSTSDGSSGPNTSTIVGAVFGILTGLTLCIFAAFCYRRHRKRNRIAPSTAFMNYRSTTEQPPSYQFRRTSFFQRTRGSFSGGFGADSKSGYPHPFAPSAGVAGLGYGSTAAGSGVSMGAGGRRLMTLDEKSNEGRESAMSAPLFSSSYENQQQILAPGQFNGGTSAGPGANAHDQRMTSIDGVARTLTPPLNSTDKFGSASTLDQNPYDGLAAPAPVPEMLVNPFSTPPASDSNLAGRGAWGHA